MGELFERYRSMMDRADAVQDMARERANRIAHEAGLGDAYGHLHNAMVAADQGRPWPEVDYRLARKARRVAGRSFEAHRVVRRWFDRQTRVIQQQARG